MDMKINTRSTLITCEKAAGNSYHFPKDRELLRLC